jgi:hypothetical protein
MKRLSFLFFIIFIVFCRASLAEDYTAIYMQVCTSMVGDVCGYEWKWACPGGGIRSGGNVCRDAPDCSSGQVRSTITGLCEGPSPHTCVIPEDPTKANCIFPDDQPSGLNCTDGSTVYPPMVCPYSLWDSFFAPDEGESQTCSDGIVATYPSSCFEHWKITDAQNPFGMQKSVGIVLGTMGGGLGPKPVLRVAGTLNDGLPSIRAVLPLEAKINQAGTSAYAAIDTSIPSITLGKAVSEYIKSAPSSAYATGLASAAVALGGMALVLNSNTGTLTPVGSSVPLTSNQIGDLALRTHSTNPIPLTEIQPFINYGDVPWLEPALDAIDVDFKRVYDPAGSKPAINFPNINSSSPSINPFWDFDPSLYGPPLPDDWQDPQNPKNAPNRYPFPPIADLGPESPTQYLPAPVPSPTTQPDPAVNPNPTGTDQPTAQTPAPDPNTAIDPTASELPPIPPVFYPDTWKYFDFLPMANPFVFDISKYLPKLPNTTCYYEIHKTFSVPRLGQKHFDFAPCASLQPLRAVLNWVFAVITGFSCFLIIFRSSL